MVLIFYHWNIKYDKEPVPSRYRYEMYLALEFILSILVLMLLLYLGVPRKYLIANDAFMMVYLLSCPSVRNDLLHYDTLP